MHELNWTLIFRQEIFLIHFLFIIFDIFISCLIPWIFNNNFILASTVRFIVQRTTGLENLFCMYFFMIAIPKYGPKVLLLFTYLLFIALYYKFGDLIYMRSTLLFFDKHFDSLRNIVCKVSIYRAAVIFLIFNMFHR
jgi:hypothetical protein